RRQSAGGVASHPPAGARRAWGDGVCGGLAGCAHAGHCPDFRSASPVRSAYRAAGSGGGARRYRAGLSGTKGGCLSLCAGTPGYSDRDWRSAGCNFVTSITTGMAALCWPPEDEKGWVSLKADLDRLMSARGLDVIFVACDHYFSAPRDYLTGGVAITSGFVLKTPGEAPVIFANDMEIEEAAKTGLRVVSFSELGWWQLLKDTGGDRTKAQVAVTGKCLEAVGVASG